jgi:uncharacterized protein (DUF1330 family)
MKYYCIAEIEITNRDWIPDYVANVTKLVEARGGRYLARTAQVEKIEGARDTPLFVLILEWPSREVALAFYESEEYRPYRELRKAGAESAFFLVAGEDVAQTARISD